jgi:hypothetical protein
MGRLSVAVGKSVLSIHGFLHFYATAHRTGGTAGVDRLRAGTMLLASKAIGRVAAHAIIAELGLPLTYELDKPVGGDEGNGDDAGNVVRVPLVGEFGDGGDVLASSVEGGDGLALVGDPALPPVEGPHRSDDVAGTAESGRERTVTVPKAVIGDLREHLASFIDADGDWLAIRGRRTPVRASGS